MLHRSVILATSTHKPGKTHGSVAMVSVGAQLRRAAGPIVKIATLARKVSYVKRTAERLPDAFAADEETEAEAASIGSMLLERFEQLLDFAGRQPAALVLDVDLDVIALRRRPQRDVTARRRELERVLQEVRDGAREDLRVDLDRDAGLDGSHAEREAVRRRLDASIDLRFLDDAVKHDALALDVARVEPHVDE